MWKVGVAVAGLTAISLTPPPGAEALWWGLVILLAVGGMTLTIGDLLGRYGRDG